MLTSFIPSHFLGPGNVASPWVAEQVRQTQQPLDQCLPYGNPSTLAAGIDYGMYSIPGILSSNQVFHNYGETDSQKL